MTLKKTAKSIWGTIFPGFVADGSGSSSHPELAPTDALPVNAFYDDFFGQTAAGQRLSDEEQPLGIMPVNRLAKYAVFQTMGTDPTIDSALKMHLSHSLSATPDTNEVVSIESTSDKDDPITIDLRNTFKDLINKNCQAWAYNASLYGVWYCRIYGQPGVGVELVRSDYYTHPRFMRAYERSGNLVGYSSAWQRNFKAGHVSLMPPWSFVPFKIPYWNVDSTIEPFRADGKEFDIANDILADDGIVESLNYGQSLIETSFGPWLDLQEAILSLNMSRKNAARMERMVGVNTGKLSPTAAAQYLVDVANNLNRVQKNRTEQSLRRGFVQTIVNHLIPIWGDSKGRLEISTIEGNPNIDGLGDVDFHIKRLGAALGIDPSLLGFGSEMSGSLGEGGFFRLSILAAIRSALLRRAVLSGIETLFDIHIGYKFNKVFLPGEKPYRIMFNSVSSALDREQQENRESRANLAGMMATLIQTLDPEMQTVDRQSFYNYLWTDIMRVDEEKFRAMFPKEKSNIKIDPSGGDAGGGGGVMESAIIQDCLRDIYGR